MAKKLETALSYAKFALMIAGDLAEVGRALFTRHEGDVEAARQELRSIRDHGSQLEIFQEEIKSRLADLKARTAERKAAVQAPGTPAAGEGDT